MSEADVVRPRTEEEHATARRRVLPFALAAVIVAVAAMALLLRTQISDGQPPSILGVNLAFCAMMMGVGIALYAKPTPGTRPAIMLSLLAVLLGAAGPFLFFKQGFDWRIKIEQREMGNLKAIAQAAVRHAEKNGGEFPTTLQALFAADKTLTDTNRFSPYPSEERAIIERAVKKGERPVSDLESYLKGATDYVYMAGDLKLDPAKRDTWPGNIIIVTRNEPIMRQNLPMAFLDGTANMFKLDDVEKCLAASNAARVQMGLQPNRPPSSVERAATQKGP